VMTRVNNAVYKASGGKLGKSFGGGTVSPKLLEMYPGYDDYQDRTEREIPVIVCSPAPVATS
jgi:hypothetical protein